MKKNKEVNKKMKYGHFLHENGTIGFIAPAFGCNIEPYYTAFQHSLEIWKEKGFYTNCGPNVYEGSGIGISNTPEKCAAEFSEWYQREDCDILLSCGGGELMCESLDDIDFEEIKNAPPKWFMGYSDNTNLTFLLATLCDTASIYGPCAAAFGMEPWHESLQAAYQLLTGASRKVHGYELWEKESLKTEENPLCPYHVTEPRILHKFPDEDSIIEEKKKDIKLLKIKLGSIFETQEDLPDNMIIKEKQKIVKTVPFFNLKKAAEDLIVLNEDINITLESYSRLFLNKEFYHIHL